MSEFDQWKKKIKKEIERTYEVNENSDFPVHERYTREENFLTSKGKDKQEKNKRIKK